MEDAKQALSEFGVHVLYTPLKKGTDGKDAIRILWGTSAGIIPTMG